MNTFPEDSKVAKDYQKESGFIRDCQLTLRYEPKVRIRNARK